MKKLGKVLLSILVVISIVILLAFTAFNILFYKSPVVGVSMQPTFNIELEEGLSTAEYEASNIKDKAYVYRFGKGKVGDVVLVQRGEGSSARLIIKRIIATGGQTVNIQEYEGKYYFYINGERLEEDYIKDYTKMVSCYTNFNAYKQTLGLSQDQSITLAEDEIFVMGDNRGNSNDSSVFGPVKTSSVKGVVSFIVRYDQNLIGYLFGLLFENK